MEDDAEQWLERAELPSGVSQVDADGAFVGESGAATWSEPSGCEVSAPGLLHGPALCVMMYE